MPTDLGTRARHLWAKTEPNGSPAWHPLVLHLLDVAASADIILQREPETTRARMGQVLGLSWDEARPWLLFVIACHDLGKACPGFQAKWGDLLSHTGLRMPRAPDTRVHHAFVSQLVLAATLEALGWPIDLAEMTADAVGCHHGERASEKAKAAAMHAVADGAPVVRSDWEAVRTEIVSTLLAVFQPGAPPTKADLSGPDFMLLAGLTSFADWIGSNQEWFGFGTPEYCDDLETWMARRRQVAAHGLDSIGWAPRTPLTQVPQRFEQAFRYEPRPLQRAMAEAVADLKGPAVILVEAPMGEGKTEAAFYAHLELQRRFGHRGMYVALPTKATGNAMFGRTLEFLKGCDVGRRLDLQLVHGAKMLSDAFQVLRLVGIDDERPGGNIRAAEWFTNKKRALLSEYGVGTIDQALVPILPVRHQFVRLWGLANRVVVLDEIHAYDAYTGTLLQHLLTWLQALGSSVVLLSATLSPGIRRELAAALGSTLPGEEATYPRLSVLRDGHAAIQVHFEADPARRVSVGLCPLAPETPALRTTLEQALHDGGMGLALVNTVQRAQELYREFPCGQAVYRSGIQVGKRLADGTTVLLFHARFPADERQLREEEALEMFGRGSDRAGRTILIATQVAEQSLDLDFDVIVTDLAPIDLILQRAGRLWRHTRASRPVASAVLHVCGLGGEAPPDFGRPLWWGKVYREDLLLRTWALLRTRDVLVLPNEIDSLVAAVYEEAVEIPEVVRERLDQAEVAAQGERLAQRANANMSIIGLPDDDSWNTPAHFVLHDEDDPLVHRTLMAQTRLADDSITIIPLFPHDGYRPDEVPDGERAKTWFLRSLGVSRRKVVKTLRKEGIPPGWRESPLLRSCMPLTLDAAGRWVRDERIRLDRELGLVYEAGEAD